MKFLKYIILALTLLNLPGILLVRSGPTMGSILSYLTFALLILYFIFKKGGEPNIWLLVLGIGFYLISGMNFFAGTEPEYFIAFIKYIIIIVCGSVLVRDISANELCVFLLIGAVTIILEAAFFEAKLGRYGGLYINPNMGGFIAIMAYCLTFQIKKFYQRTIAQMVITLGGLVTFSRSFIVIWLLVNLISIKISIKNVRILAAGFGLFVLLLVFGSMFNLNTQRLKAFNSVLSQDKGALKKANEESRTETWAYYYDYILEKPIFGNGYNSFSKHGLPPGLGVHNSYLYILGESGIFPFLLFSGLAFYFLVMGLKLFDRKPFLLMQAVGFTLFMMAFHNFMTTDSVLIITLWMFAQIKKTSEIVRIEKHNIAENDFTEENYLLNK